MELQGEQDQEGQDTTVAPNSFRRSFSFEQIHSHDPYPLYALARKEEPIFFSPQIGAWVVTRYSDVRSILLQPEIFSSKDAQGPVLDYPPEIYAILSTGYPWVPHAVNTDGTEHLRFRAPLNTSFPPPKTKAMHLT